MASTTQHIGETGLRLTLEFPDAKVRADFEAAFRGWATQYQQAAGTRRMVAALAAGVAAPDRGEDTAGYLMKVWEADGSGWYLDFI